MTAPDYTVLQSVTRGFDDLFSNCVTSAKVRITRKDELFHLLGLGGRAFLGAALGMEKPPTSSRSLRLEPDGRPSSIIRLQLPLRGKAGSYCSGGSSVGTPSRFPSSRTPSVIRGVIAVRVRAQLSVLEVHQALEDPSTHSASTLMPSLRHARADGTASPCLTTAGPSPAT